MFILDCIMVFLKAVAGGFFMFLIFMIGVFITAFIAGVGDVLSGRG